MTDAANYGTGQPWPPTAAHLHGFNRAIVAHIPYEDGSGSFPVGMVDGVENHRAPRGRYDQRRTEWYEWYKALPESEQHHRCIPAAWCCVAQMAEVIQQAITEGVQMPPWVVVSGSSGVVE